VRCVGRKAVHQVDRTDLCALTEEAAAVTGLPLAWHGQASELGAPAEARTRARPPVVVEQNEWHRETPPDPVH
jgi:hypothetical protein